MSSPPPPPNPTTTAAGATATADFIKPVARPKPRKHSHPAIYQTFHNPQPAFPPPPPPQRHPPPPQQSLHSNSRTHHNPSAALAFLDRIASSDRGFSSKNKQSNPDKNAAVGVIPKNSRTHHNPSAALAFLDRLASPGYPFSNSDISGQTSHQVVAPSSQPTLMYSGGVMPTFATGASVPANPKELKPRKHLHSAIYNPQPATTAAFPTPPQRQPPPQQSTHSNSRTHHHPSAALAFLDRIASSGKGSSSKHQQSNPDKNAAAGVIPYFEGFPPRPVSAYPFSNSDSSGQTSHQVVAPSSGHTQPTLMYGGGVMPTFATGVSVPANPKELKPRKHLHPAIYKSQPATTAAFPTPPQQSPNSNSRTHHHPSAALAFFDRIASSGRGSSSKHQQSNPDKNAVVGVIPNSDGLPPRPVSAYPFSNSDISDQTLHRVVAPSSGHTQPTLMYGDGVMPPFATGVSVPAIPKVVGRHKSKDDTIVIFRDRKVQVSEDTSLYAQCRSWLRNGVTLETQPHYADCVKSLPKPLPASEVESIQEDDMEIDEETKDVEHLSAKDLLQQHVKHAKKVRTRFKNQRLQRIERYKDRLALLLPPVVDLEPENDPAS